MVGSSLITSILSDVIWALLSGLLQLVLSLLNTMGEFFMKPFNFSTNMFVSMFGATFLNQLNTIITTAGLSISILLLIFGLLRVYSGRLNDDIPNPYALVGKFIIAIFCNYWLATAITDYIFPFAQSFFNKVLNLQLPLSKVSGTDLLNKLTDGTLGSFSNFVISTNGTFKSIEALFGVLLFLICVIAATINLFKLVAENAERYFTINLLVLSAPLASATIVSEKSIQIFKNWFNLMISNVLTIIFNLVGYKLCLLAFSNCFSAWGRSTGDLSTDAGTKILSLISLIAISKMAQRLDQLLAQIVFKVNPIQNRSFLMSSLGVMKSLETGSKLLTGKGLHSLVTAPFNRGGGAGKSASGGASTGETPSGSNANPLSGISGASDTPVAGKKSNIINADAPIKQGAKLGENTLGMLDKNKFDHNMDGSLAGLPNYETDKDGSIDASQVMDALSNNGRITPAQASGVMSDVQKTLKKGNAVVGFNSGRPVIAKVDGHRASGAISPEAVAVNYNRAHGGLQKGDNPSVGTFTFTGNTAADATKAATTYAKENGVVLTSMNTAYNSAGAVGSYSFRSMTADDLNRKGSKFVDPGFSSRGQYEENEQ